MKFIELRMLAHTNVSCTRFHLLNDRNLKCCRVSWCFRSFRTKLINFNTMKIKICVLLVFSVCVFTTGNAYLNDYEDVGQNTNFRFLKLLQKYVQERRENRRSINDEFENWTGRWMPEKPDESTALPEISPSNVWHGDQYPTVLSHRIPMGQKMSDCDDAKTNLTVDWDGSPVNYTCYGTKIMPDRAIGPMVCCEPIPKQYIAAHECMNRTIEYDDEIPLYGTHRPLWPVYGEYLFVPKQRWIHSLEHGAVVMLYHPCANPLEVKHLKSLVKNCLWRHIITPYNYLDEDRPLALLTWGCRLTMSYVNPEIVEHFIRKKALRGPEDISDDGDFDEALLTRAKLLSDEQDSVLCPNIE